MKSLTPILLLFLLLTACNSTTFNGFKYVSSDGDFSIYFSDEPEVTVENVETEVGDIKLTSIIHEASKDKAYMVAYSDYPPAFMELVDGQELMDGGMRGALNSLNIEKPQKKKKIEKGKVQGIYFFGSNDDEDTMVEYEIFIKKNRLYQVAVIGLLSEYKHNADKQFFNSFKFN